MSDALDDAVALGIQAMIERREPYGEEGAV
jgi:hypothetical protein